MAEETPKKPSWSSDIPDVEEVEEARLRRQWEKEQEFKNAQRQKRLKEQKRRVKVIFTLAAGVVLLLVTVILLTVKVFVPLGNYNKTVKMMNNGEYSEAIKAFRNMRGYKDSDALLKECIRLQAEKLAGRENVVYGTSETHPWFSISETGVLSFDEDRYKGDWNLCIPDVFDGVLVTGIGIRSFFYCEELQSVRFSECIQTIEEYAFYGCTGLTEVQLPTDLRMIGENVFGACTGIKSVVFGEKLETIGARAFINCSTLTEVVLPDSLKTIESRAFNLCAALTEVSLPEGIETVGNYTFTGCTELKTLRYRGTSAQWETRAVSLEKIGLPEATVVFQNQTSAGE